jgi:hypothetical protein
MQTFKKLPSDAPKQKAIAQRNQPSAAEAAGVMVTTSVLTATVRSIGRQTRRLK